MRSAETIKGPDCNKPHSKLPRSNYMLPLQAKTNTQTPTLNNLPKFIFPHAHWVRAIQRWNGRGRKCLFNALATQLCALRLYSQLMSDWVVMVTTQYSNTCEWPLNIQRRYLWKKNTISNLIFWVLTRHRHLPGFSRCISPVEHGSYYQLLSDQIE